MISKNEGSGRKGCGKTRKDYFELGPGGDWERPVSAPTRKILILNRADGLIEPGVRYRLLHLQFLHFIRCAHPAVQQVRKTYSNASLQN